MKFYKLSIEQTLYLLAFVLSAGLRFLFLGREALSDPEASLALQSLGLVRGSAILIGSNPGYVLPTAVLDFMFGTTNFVARLWPAVCGILLILVVYQMRKRLGRGAGIALAFWIALDPGLNSVSRQAGSAAIGIAFCMLALASWVDRKAVWTGIWAGLALLGGPLIWPNLLALAGAAWLTREKKSEVVLEGEVVNWRMAAVGFLASLILSGTILLIVPGGLSGAASSLSTYFQGWGSASGVPVLRMLGGLLAYEILGFVLGLAGVLRGALVERNHLDRFLAVWWGIALLLTLAYPSRQVLDLSWTLIPMLALAARQIPRMLRVEENERLATVGQAVLILLLQVLIANLSISWPATETSSLSLISRWLVISVSVLLIVAETTLVAWGWSKRVGLLGLAWGVIGLFILLSLAGLSNSAGFSGREPSELWRSGPAFVEADLFVQTVKNYTQWVPDPTQVVDIVVLDLPSSAVKWILRDFPGMRFGSTVSASDTPSMLVTADRSELGLAAQYTGQSFILARSPAWDLVLPSEWTNWLIYRNLNKATWTSTNLILWVRSDLLPGSSPSSETTNP